MDRGKVVRFATTRYAICAPIYKIIFWFFVLKGLLVNEFCTRYDWNMLIPIDKPGMPCL